MPWEFGLFAAVCVRQRGHEFRFAPTVRIAGRLGLISIVITVIAVMALAAGVGVAKSMAPARQSTRALPVPDSPPRALPITDPTQLPRLAFEDLSYQGAFRLPADELGGVSFSFGGAPAAFNPENNSLFIGTHSGHVAEVSIPAPVNSRDVNALPFATLMQPFSEPSNGGIKSDISTDGVTLSGLLVYERRLLGAAVIFYDANNTQKASHFSRPLSLGEREAARVVRVGANGKTGFVAGYMATVPPEWQSRLGGPVVTGQCCIPIITRTSWGPSAFVFDPADVIAGKNADAHALLYYDSGHPTLGAWEGSNPTWGGTTQVGGVALIGGTRTVLFVGRNGSGTFCYGDGTADQALANSRRENGDHYCYDPSSADKGQHAYPYRYQIWAYDLGELAEVRAGKRDPWSVKPYGVWPLEFPITEAGVRIGGVAYDAAGHRLFIAQSQADRDGFSYRPLIHVFRTP